jgi:hypothetical protein
MNERIVNELALPRTTRDWCALRLALKRMLRALGLRCVAIRTAGR